MKNVSNAEIKRIAEKYGYTFEDIIDQLIEWEDDGWEIDAQEIEDLCANGDI